MRYLCGHFISISESDDVDSTLLLYRDEDKQKYDDAFVRCQAISIVVFLYEAFGRLSAIDVQKHLHFAPWYFHHRVELPKDVKPRITAHQDFYQTFPGLPLWSICPGSLRQRTLTLPYFCEKLYRDEIVL